MNYPNKGYKRKHSSAEAGEWKKISVEGEWERSSLKGEGEWRKINFDRESQLEEKKSIRHETMIPLQEILKSRVSTPVLKPEVLKSALLTPPLLSEMPEPNLKTTLPKSILKSTFPTPVSLSKVPTSKVKDVVLNPKISPSVEIRNFLEREALNQKIVSEQSSSPVFYSNISNCIQSSGRITKPVDFYDCALYLPDPNDIPIARKNNPESNKIYVSGVPTFVSEDTVKKIFEQCGNICSLKFEGNNVYRLQFESKENARKAIKLAGSKIGPKAKLPDTLPRLDSMRRLFIYFDNTEENSHNKESSLINCQKRNFSYKFNKQQGRQLSKLLKDENKFLEGIPDLISWLKQGECKKETSNSFLSMIKNLFETQVRKLKREVESVKINYNEAEIPVQQVMDRVSVQLDDICKVFNCAKVKNVWCYFSKWQKKNLDLCRLVTLEVRNVHCQERIEKRKEVEMDMSDEECEPEEINSSNNQFIENEKKDFDFDFQTNCLEASTNSSQDKTVKKEEKLINASQLDENDLESFAPNKITTTPTECNSNEIHSLKNHFVGTNKEDLRSPVNANSQLKFVEKTLTCSINSSGQEHNVTESTVTSVAANKIVAYREECDSNVEADKGDSSINYQINNLKTSKNIPSQQQFSKQTGTLFNLPVTEEDSVLESTVTSTVASEIFLANTDLSEVCDSSRINSVKDVGDDLNWEGDSVVESTVTTIAPNKLITESEECDSNGISSSKNHFKINKGDLVSDFQLKDLEIPVDNSIAQSDVGTHTVNTKKASNNCSQSCDNINASQNELRLMILITSFLMICPMGVNLESLCQYLNNVQPLIETQTVINVLKKFPNLFQQNYSKDNKSCDANWKFVGLNTK